MIAVRHGGLRLALLLLAACSARTPPPVTVDAGPPGATMIGRAHGGRYSGVWKEYEPPDVGAIVTMPGIPGENTTTNGRPGELIRETAWILASPRLEIVYTLMITHFPPGAIPGDLDEVLEKMLRHGISLDPDEIDGWHPSKIYAGDFPALEVNGLGPRGLRFRARAFRLGDTIVQVIASSQAGADTGDAAARFVESIHFAVK